jgi:hypothetical protein
MSVLDRRPRSASSIGVLDVHGQLDQVKIPFLLTMANCIAAAAVRISPRVPPRVS